MKQEFGGQKGPLLRLAFAVAALGVTLSIGGFIEFLATGYFEVAGLPGDRVVVAAGTR